MHCTRLDAPFGALLHLEFDPAMRPLAPTERDELRRLFSEHGLLVIRAGPLSDESQIELLSALGRIEPNEYGAPMRMEVTNQHDQSTAPDGELTFHYDYAYDPAPIPGISMYGALIEEGATPTLFVNSANVLDRLPRSLVQELRALAAAHACFLETPSGDRSAEPKPLIPRGNKGWGPDHYWTHHPAILKNSFGTETLFVCLQHTDRFIGLTRPESDRLLDDVYAALYDPAYVVEHGWAPDDLVIWDNLAVQHARPTPTEAPRTLRRYHLSDTNLTTDYIRVARKQGIM
jgi:taurine dioxygenase